MIREIMRLDDVVAAYRSVYNDFTSWENLLARMLADPIERDTVEALAVELRADGSFRKPVMLGMYEEWDQSAAADDEAVLLGTHAAVVDGTHRLCAHVLTGLQDVYVEAVDEDGYVGDFPRDESDPRYNWVMTTHIDVPETRLREAAGAVPLVSAIANGGEIDLLIWEVLMSLRVTDTVWLSSATAGSQISDGLVHVSVTWDAEAFLTLPDVITVAVVGKLTRFGFNMTAVPVRTVLEDYSDDGDIPRVIADPGAVLPFQPLFRM